MITSSAAHSSAIRNLAAASAVLVAWAALSVSGSVQAGSSSTFSGTVGRVWEDGFLLSTGSRNITVDSYDICGDFTARHVAAGDRVTITGEFEGGEFDAFSIVKGNGAAVCG
jgi:hypothetical protein